MGKMFIELLKVIFKIFATLLWGAVQLAEVILKSLGELLKSIVTKH
jgi:hypothetical protein